jgi:triphosphoribosyl-dephospho-CoA synthase
MFHGIQMQESGRASPEPGSLIFCKAGAGAAWAISRAAARVLGSRRSISKESRARLDELGQFLCSRGNQLNPAATADLVLAALFAALRNGTIEFPRVAGPAGWSGP